MSCARTDLCGGRSVMIVPTATLRASRGTSLDSLLGNHSLFELFRQSRMFLDRTV